MIPSFADRRYGSDADEPVATATFQQQGNIDLATLSDGRIVATWMGTDGFNDPGVKARIFDRNGRPLTPEFAVNLDTSRVQGEPAVAALSSGGFVIVWTHETAPPDAFDIRAQRYDASGARVGAEFNVHTPTTGFQVEPDVTALANDGFAVSWRAPQDAIADQVVVRAFDSSNVPLGPQSIASILGGGDALAHSITGLINGTFVVAWNQFIGAVDPGGGVRGQLYDATGAKIGSDFNLATTIAGQQDLPVVEALPGGGFVAAWRDASGPVRAIKAQFFSSAGEKVGNEIALGATAGGSIDIEVLTSGLIVITWAGNGGPDPFDIKAQVIDQSGALIGEEFVVNSVTQNVQNLPSITALPSGGFMVGFTHERQGDSGDVVARTFFPWRDGTAVDDVLQGDADRNFIRGLDGNDTINGGDEADGLEGGGGDDRLNGGSGADLMDGGTGNDIYVVDNIGDVVTELADAGYDTVETIRASYTLPINVEALVFNGIGSFVGTGNDSANLIVGDAGNDILRGGAGDDILEGAAGIDTMDGGTGDDIIVVDNDGDVVIGGDGTDRVIFAATVTHTAAVDVERFENVGNGNVYATLNALANSYAGGSGSGSDLVYGGDGGDTIGGAAGGDALFGQAGNDIIEGGADGDKLDGGADNDIVNGGADGDSMRGGDGDDVLIGGAGGDAMNGGTGIDIFTGGEGRDKFRFRDGETGNTTATADRITDLDLAQGERISLTLMDAIVGGADDAFTFIGTAAFGNVAGELRYEVIGGNTYVMGDTDGDGASDFMIRVDGAVVLTGTDFSL